MTDSITDSQIETLSVEAGEAGDLGMVRICRRALAGSKRARSECLRVIQYAAGEAIADARLRRQQSEPLPADDRDADLERSRREWLDRSET